jgi:hypothetical protein
MKKGITVNEAGSQRWKGVSKKARSALGRKAVRARERKRKESAARQQEVREAAAQALEVLLNAQSSIRDVAHVESCKHAALRLGHALWPEREEYRPLNQFGV